MGVLNFFPVLILLSSLCLSAHAEDGTIPEESSFPTITSSCKTTAKGGVEYIWTIDSKVSGENLMSVIQLKRSGWKGVMIPGKGSMRGNETLWYSKDAKDVQAKITVSVSPPREGKWREVMFKGPALHDYGVKIADKATVSVNSTYSPDDPAIHIINIVVSRNGNERIRYLVVVRLSNINNHPRFIKEMDRVGTESGLGPLIGFNHHDQVDDKDKAFARWEKLNEKLTNTPRRQTPGLVLPTE